jgi:hypothetical protein
MLVPIGPGEPRQITNDAIDHLRGTLLPDGKRLIFIGVEQGHGPRVYVQPLNSDGGRPQAILPENMGIAGFSTDGKHLLASSDRVNFVLYPIAGGEPKPIPGLQPGDLPIALLPDNSLLVGRREMPVPVYRVDLGTGRREPWMKITPSDPAGIADVPSIRFAADGKHYAYSVYRLTSDLYVIDGMK